MNWRFFHNGNKARVSRKGHASVQHCARKSTRLEVRTDVGDRERPIEPCCAMWLQHAPLTLTSTHPTERDLKTPPPQRTTRQIPRRTSPSSRIVRTDTTIGTTSPVSRQVSVLLLSRISRSLRRTPEGSRQTQNLSRSSPIWRIHSEGASAIHSRISLGPMRYGSSSPVPPAERTRRGLGP